MEIPAYLNEYLKEMRDIQELLLDFIDDENELNPEENDKFLNIIRKYDNSEILKKADIFKEFLYLLSSIANNHRCKHLIKRIEQILLHFKEQIKQTFSNFQIYQIFKKNKLILCFLNNKDLLKEDAQVSLPFIQYFSTTSDKTETEVGENDSYICKIIRDDMIEEFVTYVNKANYPLSSKIPKSNFETNSFLLRKSPTLIEYAAFFGSLDVVKYLQINNAEIKSDIWRYAIHGRKPEMIHFLEELKIAPHPKIFKEAIKCHFNEFAEYFIENTKNINTNISENFKTSLKYHNYYYFPDDLTLRSFSFDYESIIKYDYLDLLKFLLDNGLKLDQVFIHFLFNSKFLVLIIIISVSLLIKETMK